jgi:hypothetical protein
MRASTSNYRLVLLTIAVAVALVSSNPALAAKPDGNTLTVTVVADPGTLDVVPSAFGGPFYVGGSIQDPDTGDDIGIFHCWGFFFQGGALGVVTQEYDLFGRGKIILAGVEDSGPRAITGGTGDFRNLRGEADNFTLASFPVFDVTFTLIGADN